VGFLVEWHCCIGKFEGFVAMMKREAGRGNCWVGEEERMWIMGACEGV